MKLIMKKKPLIFIIFGLLFLCLAIVALIGVPFVVMNIIQKVFSYLDHSLFLTLSFQLFIQSFYAEKVFVTHYNLRFIDCDLTII